MKKIHPFYIAFEVLKVLFVICKMQPLDPLFLVVLCSIYITNFFANSSFIHHYLKKDFYHEFSFFNRFTQPLPPPTPLMAKIH